MTAQTRLTGLLQYGQIALCVQDLSQIAERQFEELRASLSPTELARYNRFHQSAQRRRNIACRGLLRRHLAHFFDMPAGDIVFTQNKNGKPLLVNPDINLHFNYSHSGDYVALAYCNGTEIGVDIEHTTRRNNLLRIAQHFFAPVEAQALVALPGARQRALFFQYWTLKEAYLKARGEGIFLGLDKFSFEFAPDDTAAISIHFCSDSFDSARDWQFQSLQPLPECRVGIAVHTGSPEFTVITLDH